MSIEHVRRSRGVPAKRGGRVRYTGGDDNQLGTIRSAKSGYLNIQLDGEKHTRTFHPTWELEYLDAVPVKELRNKPSNVFEAILAYGHDDGFEPSNDCQPTTCPPGTASKVDVLRERNEKGQPLFHAEDAQFQTTGDGLKRRSLPVESLPHSAMEMISMADILKNGNIREMDE